MKAVKQEVKFCKVCEAQTLHYKNGKKINWLLHIFLMIVTAGLWLIPFILILILGMNVWDSSKWTCSKCGGIE